MGVCLYCLDASTDEVTPDIDNEIITPCSDFLDVDCGDLIPLGGCRQLNCN